MSKTPFKSPERFPGELVLSYVERLIKAIEDWANQPDEPEPPLVDPDVRLACDILNTYFGPNWSATDEAFAKYELRNAGIRRAVLFYKESKRQEEVQQEPGPLDDRG